MSNTFFASVCFLLLISTLTFGQTAQKDLLAKKWNYQGIEEFGVVRAPDSTQKSDWLTMNADGSYEWMQEGKKTSGTWKLNESAKIIVFTNAATKKSLSYNLKGITDTDLIIEYQTPDLVRTRYRYQVAK